MGYQWDVFLSYKRSNYWSMFVKRHFLPMLELWLGTVIGREIKIFVDVDQMETGDPWPYKLADGLARSKTMICLWSREYFSSRWCSLELSQMLARRKSITGPSGPPPIILAVVIHDTERVDRIIADIQRFPLQDYCNPWIADYSLTAERLSFEIRRFAEHVADALIQAPEYDETWPSLVTDEFLHLFNHEPYQGDLPRLG